LHRLDKEASGLVLFSLTEAVRAPLHAALTEGHIERRYIALVAGRLDGAGRIALRIARHPRDPRLRVALPENAPAGLPAVSHFEVLAHGQSVTAVELKLETGRTHQLRVHLSAIGHPIVGDRFYGGPQSQRLFLHAHLLRLPHPLDGRLLKVRAALPAAFGAYVPGLTSPSS
jgi:23S rRNA-/tRNA-specific pseudouridylate synthase